MSRFPTLRVATPLILVGASVRAAAQSAARAGSPCVGIDLFADQDLVEVAPLARRIDPASYPLGLEDSLRDMPDAPWIYTGALENHPDLIDRMAGIRPLLGNSGEALRGVRDPVAWTRALSERGLPVADVRLSAEGLPRDGSWLVKPIASAGGRGIHPLDRDHGGRDRAYYQRRIDGMSLSAIFVGNRDGSTALLGITRQIIGRAGEPFAYVGSVGPSPIGEEVRRAVSAIGEALVAGFGLRGLFGIDLILESCGRPQTVEINPRYTASVEVLELATGRPMLIEHLRAFGLHGGDVPQSGRACTVGKAILFADRAAILPTVDRWRPKRSRRDAFAVPAVADIPARGAVFGPGEPVLTVFAKGSTPESCHARLVRRLERWKRRLCDVDAPRAKSP